jgi:hypothetical protein
MAMYWVGTTLILILSLSIVSLGIGVPVFSFIDIVRTPRSVWEDAGHDKTAWIVAVLLGSFIGGLIYLFSIRPSLRGGSKGSNGIS